MKVLSQINENEDAATKEYVDNLVVDSDLIDSVVNAVLASFSQNLISKETAVDLFYPVGSILITLDSNFNPESEYSNTTWERIADGIFLESNSIPGTETQAGLPNIVGTLEQGNGAVVVSSVSGAFSGSTETVNTPTSTGSTTGIKTINFSASNANSIYGNASTVQPHSLTVVMWKRTM